MANEIKVTIKIDNKQLLQKDLKNIQQSITGIGKTAKQSQSSLKKFGDTFKNIGKAVFSLKGAIAGLALGVGLKAIIDEASNLENSLTGLNSVAINTGNDINFVTKAAKDLAADGVIPLTDVSASLKSLLATGLDAPKAIEVFKSLREAAAFNRQGQLSMAEAVRGAADGIKNQNSIMVDNAGITKNLSVLVKEYASEIGKSVAELTEQEKTMAIANGVIREGSLFAGDYAKSLNTFSGATTKASGNFRFFLADLGQIITKSPAVLKVIDAITEIIRDLRKSVNENREAILKFIGAGFNSLVDASEFVLIALSKVVNGFKTTLTIGERLNQGMELLSQKYLEFLRVVNKARITLNEFLGDQEDVSAIKKSNKALKEQIDTIKDSIRLTSKEIEQRSQNQEQFANKVIEISSKIKNAVKQNIIESSQFRIKTVGVTAEKLAEIQKKIAVKEDKNRKIAETKRQNALNKQLKNLAKFKQELENVGAVAVADPFKALNEGLDKFLSKLTKEQKIKLKPEIEQAELVQTLGIVTGFGKKVLQGAEGAKDLLIKGASAAIGTIVPGLGQAVGPLLEVFAQGPEKVKEMVRQFVKALPLFINNIIASVPVFIEELVKGVPLIIDGILAQLPALISALIDSIPVIINAFVDSIPQIIDAFINNLPAIVIALSSAMPQVAIALASNMPEVALALAFSMPEVALALALSMPKVALELLKSILPGFKKITDSLKKVGEILFGVLTKGAKKLFDGIIGGAKFLGNFLVNGAKKFVRSILAGAGDFIKKLISGITGGLLGGDSGGIIPGVNIIPDSIPIIGGLFAKGGKIPQGFPNDTFVGGMTSGEIVVDRSTVGKLENFLANQPTGQNQNGNGNITDILLTRVIDLLERPITTEASIELNDRTFADILLTLDRTNARIAV